MDTAYKTRAWWMLRALAYADGLVDLEDNPPKARPHLCIPLKTQEQIWVEEMKKCTEAAFSDKGAECLTRIYVDRQGNFLPQYAESVR